MALQQVNLGTPPSALDGDDPRTAFTRINNNSQFLDMAGYTAPIGRPVPNDDCNQAVTEGWWTGASGSAANRPPNMTFPLIYVVTIGGYIVQSAVDLVNGRRAGRAFDAVNGQWSDWGREAFLSDLGSAAFAAVVESAIDRTVGRLMSLGSHGWGGDTPVMPNLNLNNTGMPTGRYWLSTPTNGPSGLVFYGFLDQSVMGVSVSQRLTYFATGAIRTFERISPDITQGQGPWVETTPFGLHQTWVNMSAERAGGVTYTNNTGRPIQVSALFGPSSQANVTIAANINGNTYIRGNYAAAAGNYITSRNMVVPAGATYSLTPANGTAALIDWHELRG